MQILKGDVSNLENMANCEWSLSFIYHVKLRANSLQR